MNFIFNKLLQIASLQAGAAAKFEPCLQSLGLRACGLLGGPWAFILRRLGKAEEGL